MNDIPGTSPTPEQLVSLAERIFGEARQMLQEMRIANRLNHLKPDGTSEIFYRDNVIHAALPWADVDQYQRTLLEMRAPYDPTLLFQVVDLMPSLKGRLLIDVGSFTGSLGFLLRAFLRPDETHMFEPQQVMRASLQAAINRNMEQGGGPITLHHDIIEEADRALVIGDMVPQKLHQTRYLHRQDGPLKGRSIDSFGFKKVGLINLDLHNDKFSIFQGAMETIKRDRPFILSDLTARDSKEVEARLQEHGYSPVRMGRETVMYVPEE